MNRAAILFLALAILLAHMVAIHQAPDGSFGPAYDIAHVAYRLGRNLVHDGELAWNPGDGVQASYPSLAWVAVSAFAERLYLSPSAIAQGFGMLCTLSSVVFLTQFSMRRRAGLIAPMLLATSGCAAAAGTSGTEASLAMLLVTTTLLAFERRRPKLQTLSGVLLVTTRPAASLFVLVLLLFEFVDRPRDEAGVKRRLQPWAAIAPLLALLTLSFLRHDFTGQWFTPTGAQLLEEPLGNLSLGSSYVLGFLGVSGSAMLLAIPLLCLVTGVLSGIGRRSLVLASSWLLFVAMTGGDELPFWNAIAPALPLLFLSIQESITELMDRRRSLQPVMITALTLGIAMALIASKVPGSVGPIRLEAAHRAWVQPSEKLQNAFACTHGRLGVLDEIRRVTRLRSLGVFLREEVPQTVSIGTSWPGAIGYLSRRTVHDLLGRTNPAPGSEQTEPWSGLPDVRLSDTIARGDTYLVPLPWSPPENETAIEYVRAWLAPHGVRHEADSDPSKELRTLLSYEFASVPVPLAAEPSNPPSHRPFLLLRNRAVGLSPKIELAVKGGSFAVRGRHEGHVQIVDLSLSIEQPDGSSVWMRPTGEWVSIPSGAMGPMARTDLQLYDSGPRPISLIRGKLPPGSSGLVLQAQLHDPNAGLLGPGSAITPPSKRRL